MPQVMTLTIRKKTSTVKNKCKNSAHQRTKRLKLNIYLLNYNTFVNFIVHYINHPNCIRTNAPLLLALRVCEHIMSALGPSALRGSGIVRVVRGGAHFVCTLRVSINS